MEAKWEGLKACFQAEVERLGIPGASLGMVSGEDQWVASFGVTNVDHPLPVTEETLFQIGSITKTFVATLIMRLVELGKLELDRPVRHYLPNFSVVDQAASEQATIRHLLTHRAGWYGDVFRNTGHGETALATYVDEMRSVGQLAPVGQHGSYNNAGFSIAGRLIEVATGQTFEAALEAYLFEPLGLKMSFIWPTDVMVHRFAVGHSGPPDGQSVMSPWPLFRSAFSAGAIVCSMPDLMRYGRFHMTDGVAADGGRLVQPAGMHTIHAPHAPFGSGLNADVGLAFFLGNINGVKSSSHGGGTVGQISWLSVVPAQNFALGIMTNSMAGRELTQTVLRYCWANVLDAPLPEPIVVTLTNDQKAALVGRYGRPYADLDISEDESGQLWGVLTPKQGFPENDMPPPAAGPPFPISATNDDQLVVTDGPTRGTLAQLVRNEDGQVEWIRVGSRLHRRYSD